MWVRVKSKCSRYVHVGRIHVRLNGEQLGEVDYF